LNYSLTFFPQLSLILTFFAQLSLILIILPYPLFSIHLHPYIKQNKLWMFHFSRNGSGMHVPVSLHSFDMLRYINNLCRGGDMGNTRWVRGVWEGAMRGCVRVYGGVPLDFGEMIKMLCGEGAAGFGRSVKMFGSAWGGGVDGGMGG
jgi:hypothetical protein